MCIKTDSMQLTINGDRLIAEVQHDFSQAYPFLKIEFFRNGLVRKDRYPASMLLSRQMRIKEAWKRPNTEPSLELGDFTTVAELENLFMNNYGLSVQVFRKSGNLWLETTMTDNWTLKQQNDHGKEISDPGR